MSNPRTIKGTNDFLYVEGVCGKSGTLPGQAVEQISGGNFQPQTTSGAPAEVIIPLENSLFGSGVTGDYASGQVMRLAIPQRGCLINVKLACTSGSGLLYSGAAMSPLSGGSWDLTSRVTGGVQKATFVEAAYPNFALVRIC